MTEPPRTARLLAADAIEELLDHEPADQVVHGSPTVGVRTLGRVGAVEVGVWEITEGVVRDTEVDEIFLVLSGEGRVDFEDGTHVDLSPGVAVRLRSGERTTWTVTSTLRKVWIA